MYSLRTKSSVPSLACLVSQASESYKSKYRNSPEWIVAAPGRVNLIGEHIDYNDGFVLPMAIERYVVVAAGKREEETCGLSSGSPKMELVSVHLNEAVSFEVSQSIAPSMPPSWDSYSRGVVAGFLERFGDSVIPNLPSLNLLFESNIPMGGGLSSSAALEVATATMLEAITGIEMPPIEKALLCQQAEHRFAGVPCGIMDQFSSVFGQENAFILLDCRSQEIELVPFAPNGVSVLITNSNVKHELTGGEYAQRRTQCDSALKKIGASSWREVSDDQLLQVQASLTEVERRRAKHVVTETKRTVEATDAIRSCRWHELGMLMHASHDSLRDDFEVSCPEIDVLVEFAREIGVDGGVFGSRMTGGGFGGCTVTLVDTEKVEEVSRVLKERYENTTGIEPQMFASLPARGAHVVEHSFVR